MSWSCSFRAVCDMFSGMENIGPNAESDAELEADVETMRQAIAERAGESRGL